MVVRGVQFASSNRRQRRRKLASTHVAPAEDLLFLTRSPTSSSLVSTTTSSTSLPVLEGGLKQRPNKKAVTRNNFLVQYRCCFPN
jgi:hypothetical protein